MAPRVIVDTYPRACAHGVQRLAQLTALFAYHYKYRQLGSKLLIERNTKASMMMGKSSPSTSPVYAVAAALLLVYLMVAMGAGVVEAAVVPPSSATRAAAPRLGRRCLGQCARHAVHSCGHRRRAYARTHGAPIMVATLGAPTLGVSSPSAAFPCCSALRS